MQDLLEASQKTSVGRQLDWRMATAVPSGHSMPGKNVQCLAGFIWWPLSLDISFCIWISDYSSVEKEKGNACESSGSVSRDVPSIAKLCGSFIEVPAHVSQMGDFIVVDNRCVTIFFLPYVL